MAPCRKGDLPGMCIFSHCDHTHCWHVSILGVLFLGWRSIIGGLSACSYPFFHFSCISIFIATLAPLLSAFFWSLFKFLLVSSLPFQSSLCPLKYLRSPFPYLLWSYCTSHLSSHHPSLYLSTNTVFTLLDSWIMGRSWFPHDIQSPISFAIVVDSGSEQEVQGIWGGVASMWIGTNGAMWIGERICGPGDTKCYNKQTRKVMVMTRIILNESIVS